MAPVRSLYFRELRPLLIFRGLLGGVSFEEVDVDGRLLAKVKLLSSRVGLFALLRAIDVTLAILFLQKVLKFSADNEKDLDIADVCYVSGTLLHFVIPLLAAARWQSQLDYINAWHQFEIRFEQVTTSKEFLQFGVQKWCYKVLAVLACFVLFNIASKFILFNSHPTIDTNIQQLSICYISLGVLSWYASCKLTKLATQKTISEFKKLRVERFSHYLEKRLLDFCFVFLELKNVTLALGDSSSLVLCYIILADYLIGLLFAYVTALSLPNSKFDIIYIIAIVCSVTWSVNAAICFAGYSVEKQIKSSLQTALTEMKQMKKCGKSTKIAMCKFFSHTMQQMPSLSFNGYMPVNKQLFATLISSFFGNLILLIQSRLDFDEIKSVQNRNASSFMAYGDKFN